MRPDGPVRVATRGSRLALTQARSVARALEERRVDVELVEVETRGDQVRDELVHRLGPKGAFVHSLDDHVREGEADLAVHSMKDVPTEGDDDLVVAAVPERAVAGDAFVTPDGRSLDDLPAGATVGTASQRRGAQVRARRPDVAVAPLRGNVDTRLEKLLAPSLQAEHERRLAAAEEESDEYDETPQEWFDARSELERAALGREVETEYDAIVLAQAGLDRLGLADDVPLERLEPAAWVPSPGQGALAVTGRPDDPATEAVRQALDHRRTRVETTAERTVLAELGGGCVAPVGVYAVVQGSHVHVEARVYGPDGEKSVSASRDLPVESYAEAAADLAADMADDGARDLVAAAEEANA